MAEIRFDTGIVEYTLNDTVKVRFNPTDLAFAERLYSTFDALDKKQDENRAEIEKVTDTRAIFDIARAKDNEMRAMIDGIFGEPVCDQLFGSLNVYAMSDGLPIWCNFLLSIMDELDSSFAREHQLTNPRVQKYTAKYRRH